jgi:Pin2-interacting protein X1
MGHLAESKRKTKLLPSHHAHSTWSKSAPSTSIGFKLMSSMGWAPGKGLGNDLQGKKDNVKYSLKDDTLGVGARKEYGGGLWRGTAEVDDLYRKLEVGAGAGVAEQEEREEVVVKTGWKMKFQVGDTYTSSFSMQEEKTEDSAGAGSETTGESTEEATSKKRKRGDDKEKSKKKAKKEKAKGEKIKRIQSEEEAAEQTVISDKTTSAKANSKSQSKCGRYENVDSGCHETTSDTSEVDTHTDPRRSDTTDLTNRKKRKDQQKHSSDTSSAERKSKKDKKRKSKEKRKDKSKDPDIASSNISSASGTSTPTLPTPTTPTDTGASTPIRRHMHRARFRAMKNASIMDQNALREILGVAA